LLTSFHWFFRGDSIKRAKNPSSYLLIFTPSKKIFAILTKGPQISKARMTEKSFGNLVRPKIQSFHSKNRSFAVFKFPLQGNKLY